MPMKTSLLLFFACFLLIRTLPAQNENNPETPDFAFKLLNLMRQKDSNFVYSPFSIYNAATLLNAGASGETQNEIDNLFGFSKNNETFLDNFFKKKIGKDTIGSDDYKLFTANSLWTDKNIHPKDSFVLNCTKYLNSKVFSVDFTNNAEESRLKINEWISGKTFWKIPKLLPALSVDNKTKIVLTNALYFKALWEHSFDKESTAKGKFYTPQGEKEVDFMNRSGLYKCYFGDSLTALSLPYKERKAEMLIIQPKNIDKAELFFSKMNSEKLNSIILALEAQKIHVALPKFALKNTSELNEILPKAGLDLSFTPRADFSKIADIEGLYITAAFHSSFIEINETGTEAAASTAVVMGRSISPNLLNVILNSPFLFIIRDIENGDLIFMGICYEPKTQK